MKWSSTAVAVVVLAVSAPVRADQYNYFEQDVETPSTTEGPEIALPHPTAETSTLAPADGKDKKDNKKKNDKKQGKGDQQTPMSTDNADDAAPAAPLPPGDSSVLHGTMSSLPQSGVMYGGASTHGDYGASAHCCEEYDDKAMHAWDDYCSTKGAIPVPGWLMRRNCESCSAPADYCSTSTECCGGPAPRPLFSRCKPHFGWAGFRPAAPACESYEAPVCESEPMTCASEPLACECNNGCEACDAVPCECGKSGLLGKLFARFSAKHHRGCVTEESCDVLSSAEMGSGEVYEYENSEGIDDLPTPPAPVVPMDNPAAEADAKSARRYLLPEALRLFPIGR